MLAGDGDGGTGQRCSSPSETLPPSLGLGTEPAPARPEPLPGFPAPRSSLTAAAASRVPSLLLGVSPLRALAAPTAPHVAAGTSLQDHLAAAPGPRPPIGAGGSAALCQTA